MDNKRRNKNIKASRTNYDSKKRGCEENYDKGSRNGSRSVRSNGTNDPSWYYYSERAAQDNAALNFGTQSGVPLDLHVVGNSTSPSTSVGYNIGTDAQVVNAFPGILAIYHQPTIGRTDGPTAPINQAAFELYTKLRMKQKITYNYDAPDLMKYVICMSSMYSLYAHLNRIYGLLNLYIRENNYLPKSLLTVLGVNVEDLKANIYDFRAWLNNQAYLLSKFSVPDGFYLAARWITVMSNVYVDSESAKSQMYVYVPDYFWQYDEVSGDVTPARWVEQRDTSGHGAYPLTSFMTFDKIKTFWNSLMNPLINNGDFQNMSANIALAYGNRLVSIPAVDPNYTVIPVLDRNMLLQIQNSRAMGFIGDTAIKTNTAGDNSLYLTTNSFYSPLAMFSGPGFVWDQVFNTDASRTDPASVLEGFPTLNIGEVESVNIGGSTNNLVVQCTQTGPDVPSCYRIFYHYYNADDAEVALTSTTAFVSCLFINKSDSVGASAAGINKILSNISKFDWHPLIRVSSGTQQNGTETKPATYLVDDTWLQGDIDNYTTVNRSTVKQIHDVMMLSLYRIPETTD